MTGTSSDRIHHTERPAVVAGFRPSITSQVKVSKLVDEWSDLTHGEYKQYSVYSELCMYWRSKPSDMWKAERRYHCILLNVNVQMYILNQFQDGRILRCVHVFTYLPGLFMLLSLVWIISWWIGQAIHLFWILLAEGIPHHQRRNHGKSKTRRDQYKKYVCTVSYHDWLYCAPTSNIKYYKSTQWLWAFEASRLEMGQHRLQEYQCIMSKVSRYSDASLLESSRSMNILYNC